MRYTKKLIYSFEIKILAHIIKFLIQLACHNSLENGKDKQAVIFYLKLVCLQLCSVNSNIRFVSKVSFQKIQSIK